MAKLVAKAIIVLCIYNKLPGVETTCTSKLTTKEQYIMICMSSTCKTASFHYFFSYMMNQFITHFHRASLLPQLLTHRISFCDKCNYITQVPSSKFCNQKENWQKLSLIVCAIKAVQFETTLPLLKVLANGSKLY